MTTYTVELGADHIAFLTHHASPIACAGLLGRVSTSGPDTMIFDDAVAAVLRDVPADDDGNLVDDQLWFGGIGYPVQTTDG